MIDLFNWFVVLLRKFLQRQQVAGQVWMNKKKDIRYSRPEGRFFRHEGAIQPEARPNKRRRRISLGVFRGMLPQENFEN